MPSPSRFNDPWDCKPWFDLDTLDDPAMRDAHIAQFLKYAKSPRQSDEEEMRTKPGLLNWLVEQCSQDLAKNIETNYRVYCLTPRDDNLLMWSHYAKNHTGVCLQFDVRTEPFIGACKVVYQPTLPAGTLLEHEDNAMIKALLTKSDVWGYEQEYRVIAKDQRDPSPNMPTAVNSLVDISETALVRITVGCRCNEADRIVDMVRRHQPRVSVRQASRHPHRYGVGYNTLYAGQ
ncbi:MAG: DUF2971 domain-containing protein [Bordetella sp.]|uniref:DUF2971 domain-containing protein n=1 Tax=Bordetella sp. TaxID=28081 RepID=UPI003F7CC74A